MSAKPPMRSAVNTRVNTLNLRSINSLIGSPYRFNNQATSMKRAPLDKALAMTNTGKLIEHTPALTVITLKGIGVKPAVKTTQKSYWS